MDDLFGQTLAPEEGLALAVVSAINSGDAEHLDRLLTEHAGLASAWVGSNEAGGESRSLLHLATDWPGHRPRVDETIRRLVVAGADVNARFRGTHEETPLHWAASCDDVEAIDALLDMGADIEAPGAVLGGGSPLADACGFKQWQAAARLVERGATVDLADAATLGLIDRVEAAFLATPAPTQPEIDAAFWSACHGGRLEAARFLKERGADIDWLPPWESVSPLDAAQREGADELADWLKTLSARPANDPDHVTFDGRTILSRADFYAAIESMPQTPDWFGRNLDALFDLLVGVIDRPLILHWTHAPVSAKGMGQDFDIILGVLRDAERERNSRFKLRLSDDGPEQGS